MLLLVDCSFEALFVSAYVDGVLLQAWKGFDKEAMWVELNALEASAKAAREAKARRLAEAEAAAKAVKEQPSPEKAGIKPTSSVTFSPEPPSVFAAPAAARIAEQLDTANVRDTDQNLAPIKSFKSSRSVRMPGLSKRESLLAVRSGAVAEEDLQHLEDEVEVEIPVPEQDAEEKDV